MLKKKDITVIIIAHSVRTIRNADHHIILDKSKIKDIGRPDDLKYDDSWYKRMLEQ